jgi:hypothetical protein
VGGARARQTLSFSPMSCTLVSLSAGRMSTIELEWRCIATLQPGLSASLSMVLRTRT